jgi:hypothetical protein
MNQERPIKDEQETEVFFWDKQNWRLLSEGHRYKEGDRMPCWGDLVRIDGHFWKILDDPPVETKLDAPADALSVVIRFCRYAGPATPSLG